MNYFIKAMLCLGSLVFAQTTYASNTDESLKQLEQELQQFAEKNNPNILNLKNNESPVFLAEKLTKVISDSKFSVTAALSTKCDSTTSVQFSDRYVLTLSDQDASPCAIYDYSFPTAISYTGFQTISQLSAQNFTASDYLAWIKGDFTKVYQRILELEAQPVTNSWIQKIKFRPGSAASLVATTGQPPKTFKASDLDIGKNFQFTPAEQEALKTLVETMNSNSDTMMGDQKVWVEIIEKPTSILERIRFVWNDSKKLYEVVIDGSFLPLFGPVALVNYEKPYQFAMQRLARSILGGALWTIAQYIPEPITQRIVSVVIYETFDLLETTYNYQLNLIEPVLRAQRDIAVNPALAVILDRGLDNVFASRTGFFMEYIQRMMNGKQFDWNKIEKIGRANRYNAEKARDISMNNLNSKLVLDEKCKTEIYHDYFAKCTINGKDKGIYSLLGETSVLFWNLGPTKVYSSRMPAEILAKRLVTRLLSASLGIVKLPMADYLTTTLSSALDGFAKAGIEDEAFLRGSIMQEKQDKGALDTESANIYKWLYIQHINPFLPFTEKLDNLTIQKNRSSQLKEFAHE